MLALASLSVELLPVAVLLAMLLEEDPPRSEEAAVLPDTSLARELVSEELAVDPQEVEVVAWEFVSAAEPVVELVVALVEVPEAFSAPVAPVFVAVLEVPEAGADVEDPNPAKPVPVVVVAAAAAAAVVSLAAPFVGGVEGGFEVAPLVVSDTATAALDGAFVATGEVDSAVPEAVVVDVCGVVVATAAVMAEGVAELSDFEVVAVGAFEVSDVDDPEFIAELVELPWAY
ncbi:hypothetical protein PR002_g9668 [Phytophthora rubi]|uniref:Secreted protein n=1 Tax=Phytophthora rubi TaxID=129364 RepID=A0A6A3MPX1_9STRA|nr:hypothetical protein PR002_g9668 [Phytophthora rubi]